MDKVLFTALFSNFRLSCQLFSVVLFVSSHFGNGHWNVPRESETFVGINFPFFYIDFPIFGSTFKCKNSDTAVVQSRKSSWQTNRQIYIYRTQDQPLKNLANNQIENCPENAEFRLTLKNESSWHLVLNNFSLSCFGKSQNFMLACQLGLSQLCRSSNRIFAFECCPDFLIVDPKYGMFFHSHFYYTVPAWFISQN